MIFFIDLSMLCCISCIDSLRFFLGLLAGKEYAGGDGVGLRLVSSAGISALGVRSSSSSADLYSSDQATRFRCTKQINTSPLQAIIHAHLIGGCMA